MNLDRAVPEMERHLLLGGLTASALASKMRTAMALGYEQSRGSDDPKVSGGDIGDVSKVGDRRVQRAIRMADHAVKLLVAADRILTGVLEAGQVDEDLHGSMLSAAELDRLHAARDRRAARGEQLAPVEEQRDHPSRTRKQKQEPTP